MDGQVPIVEANDAAELLVPENDGLIAGTEKINSIKKLRGVYISLGCSILLYAFLFINKIKIISSALSVQVIAVF